MTYRARNQNDMPDVPDLDFIDALCEIWAGLNYSAYHLAYVRVYLQTAALQTDFDEQRKQEQVLREMAQADVTICRAHLAAFFWQLDHIFEALRIAIARGQKEHPTQEYFWIAERRLAEIDRTPIRQEISAYRNKGHEIPAIIGCAWDKKGGQFLHHFLPAILGQDQNDSTDMNTHLQRHFEFVANLWLSFVPGDFKNKFPRSFKFAVTVPNSFVGDLPPKLKGAPQLNVVIEAYDRSNESAGTGENTK